MAEVSSTTDQIEASAFSQVKSSNIFKKRIRTMEIMTVLCYIVSACLQKNREGRGTEGSTHKKPKQKMPSSRILEGRARCSFQITGNGKQKTATSVIMLPAALMYHWGILGMHLAWMVRSQKPEMGLHVKMPTITCDRAQPPTINMLTK